MYISSNVKGFNALIKNINTLFNTFMPKAKSEYIGVNIYFKITLINKLNLKIIILKEKRSIKIFVRIIIHVEKLVITIFPNRKLSERILVKYIKTGCININN